jgi:hypothetical protein
VVVGSDRIPWAWTRGLARFLSLTVTKLRTEIPSVIAARRWLQGHLTAFPPPIDPDTPPLDAEKAEDRHSHRTRTRGRAPWSSPPLDARRPPRAKLCAPTKHPRQSVVAVGQRRRRDSAMSGRRDREERENWAPPRDPA